MKKKLNFKSNGIVPKVGGAVVGGVLAKVVDKTLFSATTTALVKGGSKLAAGIVLPMFMKNAWVDGVGAGLIALGAYQLGEQYIPGMSGLDNIISGGSASPYIKQLGAGNPTRKFVKFNKNNVTRTNASEMMDENPVK